METEEAGEVQTEADRLIPRKTLDVLAPANVGLWYDEMASLVEAMHEEDPGVKGKRCEFLGTSSGTLRTALSNRAGRVHRVRVSDPCYAFLTMPCGLGPNRLDTGSATARQTYDR